jgi:hypothetical protein
MKRFSKGDCGFVLLSLFVLLMNVSCGSKEGFTQQATTQFFTQDYNPPTLDILWMVDNRSPMHRAQWQLRQEAGNFFARLSGATSDYRMALVTADMQFAQGRLQPVQSPTVLSTTVGTFDQRLALFDSLLFQTINLQTGYADQGLESVRVALTRYFVPRAGVPLILVFVSDSDDHSPLSDDNGAASFYAKQYLAAVGNNQSLLRAYSINYQPLPNGADVNDAQWDSVRCATRYHADIDSSGFQNRYFNLATLLTTGTAQTTADLCGSFSGKIDLTGLRLKELPHAFPLQMTVKPSTLIVSVSLHGNEVNAPWTYDAATNQIVFASAPPEGSTIQVSYLPQ